MSGRDYTHRGPGWIAPRRLARPGCQLAHIGPHIRGAGGDAPNAAVAYTAGMKWVFAGVVAIIALAVGSFWYERHVTERDLLAEPIYQVLKKHERGAYRKVLEEYRHLHRETVSREAFVNFANSEITLAATRRLAAASQESLLGLVSDMVATARTLQAGDPEDCYRYWFPQVSGPPDIARRVDAAAQARTLSLMAEVIRSSAENPVPMPDAEAVKDHLAAVINATYEEFGADAQMLANAADPAADHAKVCNITISVYERILALSPANASAVMRAMTQVQ